MYTVRVMAGLPMTLLNFYEGRPKTNEGNPFDYLYYILAFHIIVTMIYIITVEMLMLHCKRARNHQYPRSHADRQTDTHTIN